MTTPERTPGEQTFWDLAEPLLGQPDITRSTMMGHPCLRLHSQFFTSTDRATGNLLVKLGLFMLNALAEMFGPRP